MAAHSEPQNGDYAPDGLAHAFANNGKQDAQGQKSCQTPFYTRSGISMFSFVNMSLDVVFIVVQLNESRRIALLVFPKNAPWRMKAECKALSLKSRSSGVQSNAGRDHFDNK